MARLMLLSNHVIDRMLNEPEFVEFSFIADPPRRRLANKTKSKGCGGCGHKRRRVPVRKNPARRTIDIDYNSIRQRVLDLDEQQREALKEKLGCTSLKVHIRSPKRGVERRVI